MAFNVSREKKTVAKEILKFPAGLDAIESVVLKGSAVAALASAVTGIAGVSGLVAGTILKDTGDGQHRYVEYTGTGTIAGILADNVEFQNDLDDQPADMLFHGCVFDKDTIKNYSSYSATLATALPTCKFIS